MEASQSPNNITYNQLYAIAKAGRSKDTTVSLTPHSSGYIISKRNGKDTHVKTNDIIELVKHMPDIFPDGKITKEFYEDVRKGLTKINFEHEEDREGVRFIAEQVFTFNQNQVQALKEVTNQTKAEEFPQEVNINQDRPLRVRENVFVRRELSERTALQNQAIKSLKQLVSPAHSNAIIRDLDDLWFIQTPEDLKDFKTLIDALVESKKKVAQQLKNNKWVAGANREDFEKITDLAARVVQAIIFKEPSNSTLPEQNYYMKKMWGLVEEVYMLNDQSSEDYFRAAYTLDYTTVKRRYDIVAGNQKKLAEQQEAKNPEKIIREFEGENFSAQEIPLVQAGYIKRGSSFNTWEKTEWTNRVEIALLKKVNENGKEIVNEETHFLSGDLTYSCAVAGHEPVTQKVSFDLKDFKLNHEQTKSAINYLETAIFGSKPNSTLLDRSIPQETRNHIKFFGSQKRQEVRQMVATTFFKAHHPDLKL